MRGDAEGCGGMRRDAEGCGGCGGAGGGGGGGGGVLMQDQQSKPLKTYTLYPIINPTNQHTYSLAICAALKTVAPFFKGQLWVPYMQGKQQESHKRQSFRDAPIVNSKAYTLHNSLSLYIYIYVCILYLHKDIYVYIYIYLFL